MINWCLTPTLAIFQLYPGVNKFYVNLVNMCEYIFGVGSQRLLGIKWANQYHVLTFTSGNLLN
jgi:hypothetical protein